MQMCFGMSTLELFYILLCFGAVPKLTLADCTLWERGASCSCVSPDLAFNDVNFNTLNALKELNDSFELIIKNSKLPTIPATSALSKFPSLGELIMRNLSIETVTPGAFHDLKDLVKLDLSENHIKEIHPRTFYELETLEDLLLDNNELASLNLQFSKTSNLNMFKASYNKIAQVEKDMFKDKPRLWHIHLSHNDISDVPFELHDLPNVLSTIDLSYNKIEKVNLTSFGELSSDATVLLQNNQINELHENIFESSVDNNIKFNFSHNQIEQIKENVFKNFENITFLDLSHNKISDITSINLHSIEVETLDLSYNKISDISNLSSKSLKTVNFGSNQLTILRKNTFVDCPSLEAILVPFNRIKIVEPETFNNLGHAFPLDIDLSHNEIENIENSFVNCRVSDLDLSYNKIESISADTIGKINSLEDLNLSNNNLKNIELNTQSIYAVRKRCGFEADLTNNDISKDDILAFFSYFAENDPCVNLKLKAKLNRNTCQTLVSNNTSVEIKNNICLVKHRFAY